MLPLTHKVLFLLFATVTGSLGVRGFYRVYRRISAGRADTDARFNHLPNRMWYALVTALTQSRTFRKRPWVSFFHSFIFYGFAAYLLVNLVDAVDGFVPLSLRSLGVAGNLYVLVADVLSFLVLVGVIALVIRRFLLPSGSDFAFNERTMLHPSLKRKYINVDSLIVSTFILFHVGSRAVGAGAKLAFDGPDRFAPFASLLAHLFNSQNAVSWRIFGYWGALGSVLAFLMYFPYSKHIHIFMAPAKYLVAREVNSGVLPALDLQMDALDGVAEGGANGGVEDPKLGAKYLEDLAWPRLLDAYACIQCNRCQDVCPATATGKSLSPSALEINKRMELNQISMQLPTFEAGAASPTPLLSFALSPEAAWACTTCGACIEVCPVQDEPMLDIIDIRREQVMIAGEFPQQLQTAFRGMERARNPWGINHEKRMDWAAGLKIKTTDENPEPDVLFWVGCAASYDPQSQKTARAFVQLLDHAGVDFAVLGKRECCTGDTARRAGNEYLYRRLADQNVNTLNEIKPRLIVATCPHCMNTVGKEYRQIGGEFKVMHHTEYLEMLLSEGKLVADAGDATVAYHDPCYLGRHNKVYDAPRNVLNILSNSVVELPRNRENSFCCGAGGAQFWKEEEAGSERISDNRYREVQQRLEGAENKVLAVGCPFCKSMLDSTPGKGEEAIAIKDIAELLLEGVQRNAAKRDVLVGTTPAFDPQQQALATVSTQTEEPGPLAYPPLPENPAVAISAETGSADRAAILEPRTSLASDESVQIPGPTAPSARKKFVGKKSASANPPVETQPTAEETTPQSALPPPLNAAKDADAPLSKEAEEAAIPATPSGEATASTELRNQPQKRKSWAPKRAAATDISNRSDSDQRESPGSEP